MRWETWRSSTPCFDQPSRISGSDPNRSESNCRSGLATDFKVSSGLGGFAGLLGSFQTALKSRTPARDCLGTAAREAKVAERSPESPPVWRTPHLSYLGWDDTPRSDVYPPPSMRNYC